MGTLLPFIPIYMQQLGLSSTEAGVIYGVMPFVAFCVRPLFGAIADKLQKHKLVLIVSVMLTGISYTLLLVTPAKPKPERMAFSMDLHCGELDSFLRDCDTAGTVAAGTCDSSMKTVLDHMKSYVQVENSSQLMQNNCQFSCRNRFASLHSASVCFTNNVGTIDQSYCNTQVTMNSSDSVLTFSKDLNDMVNNEKIQGNKTGEDETCMDYDIKNVTLSNNTWWQLLCDTDAQFLCTIKCDNVILNSCVSKDDSMSKTFWIFFFIFFVCNVVFAPVISLVDAIAYDILKDKRGKWGRQRLWGTVGFIIFAITSTFIMDQLSNDKLSVDYSASFYIFLGLTIITCIVTYFLDFSEDIQCGQMFMNMMNLLKYPKIILFLVVVSCFGAMNGVIEAFLFWYLKMLGSENITLGLCLVLNCVPEVIVFMFSGKIIKKIGHVPCLLISCLAYAIRFFYYSAIPSAWYVLPVEVLHSLTFALMYAAASSYASIITPEGMSATVQGLLGGFHFGFGEHCRYCYLLQMTFRENSPTQINVF